MEENWYCKDCNISIKKRNLSRHMNSQKHKKYSTKNIECVICCEESKEFKNCNRCKQEWCVLCDNNIFECPYCRQVIMGRQEKLQKRKIENFTWQTDDAVFINVDDRRDYRVNFLMNLFFGRPLR